MYHQQIMTLIIEFKNSAMGYYSVQHLLNNADYRNRAFQKEIKRASLKTRQLIDQIQTYEDLLDHEFRVDLTKQSDNKNHHNRATRLKLVAFAVIGMMIVVGGIVSFEQLKLQDQLNHINTQN